MRVRRSKMQVKQTGSKFEFSIEGAISEKCPLFDYSITDATEIILDLEKMTFINSIGVKNWINWTFKIPSQCKLELHKCPFVIINQVNIVQGFLPKQARIQSFFAPYISESGEEMTILCQRGTHYEYASPGFPPRLDIPETITSSDNEEFEPDFVLSKISKFLDPS